MAKKKAAAQLPLAPAVETAPDLRVLSVQVKNVLGIDEKGLDADGRAVLVTGKNGTQKTSLLSAVQAGLGGGSLAKLAKVGAEDPPEVVLVLGGPGGEYRVEKKGDDTARVRQRVGHSQAFKDVPRPQEFLSNLFDGQMANPVRWLLAPQKQQHVELLEALELEMDEDALAAELTDVETHLRPVPAGLHPLEKLAMLRDHLFQARTGVNRDAKSKAEAAEQLRRELPAKAPEDPKSEIEAAQAEVARLKEEMARDEEKAQAARREAAAAARAEYSSAVAEAKAILDEAQAAYDKAVLVADGAQEAKARDAAEAYGESEASLRKRAPEIGDAESKVIHLQDRAKEATRFEALNEQAVGFEEEAEHHKAESERLTAAIARLDAFRRALGKDLPIPGLEIEGANIRLDGVPLSQVNEAKRVEVAAKVAQARAERNPLKVLFLDGLERLDTEHRTALLSYLVENQVQPFAACVTDGEPEIRYIGAMEESHAKA